MRVPKVDVIGVYRVESTDELVKAALALQYELEPDDPEAAQATKQILRTIESTVLVELVIDDSGELTELPHIRQQQGSAPSDTDQVLYLERYLSRDGNRVLSMWELKRDEGCIRVAFFIHFFRPEVPLSWEFGDILCPASSKMPDRLMKLCPYEPVD